MQESGEISDQTNPPLEVRHRSSGLNSLFGDKELSFAAYVSAQRNLIRKIRSAYHSGNLEKAVNGNAPFQFEPTGDNVYGKDKKYRRGVLLTHGLSDSPYFMRHIARFFQESGFRVMAVLLPGHGTIPGDMLDVRWQAWLKTVAYGADQLAAEVDELYLAGYSAGGALSIYQSMQDKRVRGLFLFAPALEITHRAAYAWLHKLVSWFMPRLKWVDINPDIDIYKYESFTKNSATQMYCLTTALKRQQKKHQLNIPIFAVASEEDKTVHTSATIDFMSRQNHAANKLILYTTDSSKLVQNSTSGKVDYVNSLLPEQKILSSAHTAILISPEDGHYGVDGDYANCLDYYPDHMTQYKECMQHPKDCWLGEINEKNLKAGNLRRLMYNPNFAALKVSLSKFIASLD